MELTESHNSMEMIERDDDEDIDQPLKVPVVSSVTGALDLAKELVEFTDWSGEEPLPLAVGCVYDLLCDSQLKSLKQLSLDSPKHKGTFICIYCSTSYQIRTFHSMELHVNSTLGTILFCFS